MLLAVTCRPLHTSRTDSGRAEGAIAIGYSARPDGARSGPAYLDRGAVMWALDPGLASKWSPNSSRPSPAFTSSQAALDAIAPAGYRRPPPRMSCGKDLRVRAGSSSTRRRRRLAAPPRHGQGAAPSGRRLRRPAEHAVRPGPRVPDGRQAWVNGLVAVMTGAVCRLPWQGPAVGGRRPGDGPARSASAA